MICRFNLGGQCILGNICSTQLKNGPNENVVCLHGKCFSWKIKRPSKERKKTFVYYEIVMIKFVFSKKATKIDEILNSEDFVNFCGLLKKQELYYQVRLYTQDIATLVLILTSHR